MLNNAAYPFFAGVAGINRSIPIDLFSRHEQNSIIIKNENLVLLKNNSTREIHSLIENEKLVILNGRIYSPFQIYPDKENKNYLQKLFDYQEKHLDGNFNLLKYSLKENRLQLINDKFGTRPLFYFEENDLLFFSSHIDGLSQFFNKAQLKISEDALLHLYHFKITPNNQTLFSGIKKIPPACKLEIKNNTLCLHKYFNLYELTNESKKYSNEAETIETLNQLMQTSINRRVGNKNKIALGLSGGVDSGFIAKKIIDNGIKLTGYNIAYGSYYDEYERLDELQKKINFDLIKIKVDESAIIKSFEEANSISSEPVKFNDAVMKHLALQAKKDGFDEFWDGDGADRLFFGMNHFMNYSKYLKYYALLKKTKTLNCLLPFFKFLPKNDYKKLYLVFDNWRKGIPPYIERSYGVVNNKNDDLEFRIYNIAIKRFWEEFRLNSKSKDIRDFFVYQSINMCPENFFYPPAELQIIDNMFPVSPYWDAEFVNLSFNIPISLKVKNNTSKYILRKAASFKGDENYWFMPKIGLDNSYNYVKKSAIGKEWIEDKREKILKSDEYMLLKNIHKNYNVDYSKLIPFIIWKEKFLTNG